MRGWVTFVINLIAGGAFAEIALAIAHGWSPPSALVIGGFGWMALQSFLDAGRAFEPKRVVRAPSAAPREDERS